MTRSPWLTFLMVLMAVPPVMAASKGSDRLDREMLQMMELLREMEILKQMELMRDLHQLESPGDLTEQNSTRKSPLTKKRETPK